MKLCKSDGGCGPACDFCVFFEFNGETDEFEGKVWPNAVYVDKGYCRRFDMCTDPGYYCDNFVCRNVVRQAHAPTQP